MRADCGVARRNRCDWATLLQCCLLAGLGLVCLPMATREDTQEDVVVPGVALSSWLESMKTVDLEVLLGRRGEGERGGTRMLQPCMADLVTVGEGQEVLAGLRGRNTVIFPPGSACRESLGLASAEGDWGEGGLSGRAVAALTDGRLREGVFRGGVLWGVLRAWRCAHGSCTEWEEEEDRAPVHLESLVLYSGGEVVEGAPAWWLPVGGGALACTADRQGNPSGSSCGYLYPGLILALVGSWRAGSLLEGVPGGALALREGEGGLAGAGWWREEGGQQVAEDVSTETRISSWPHLKDVHDARTVYLAESSIPGANQGVFLRRDLTNGSLAAIYNGVRLAMRQARLSREDRKSVYRIHGWGDTVLNIPQNSISESNYSATLGHKANHAKNPNSEFRFLSHPRFGEVIGLYLTRDLVAGREVTVDYGYTEKYLAAEAGIEMMLTAAQAVSGFHDKKEFHREMKRTIGYVREKVEYIKPLVNAFKMARDFL